MTPFEVYKQYIAVKLHFNDEKYDYIKFNGKTPAKYSSYERRKDKYYFEKISKRYVDKDIVPFFVANFVNDPNIWSGDLAVFDKSARTYRLWKGTINSLSRIIKDDIKNIKLFIDERELEFTDILKVDNGTHTHPVIIRFLLQEMIKIETLIYLDNRFTFIEYYDIILIDPLWEYQSNVIKKYKRFLGHVDWNNLLK